MKNKLLLLFPSLLLSLLLSGDIGGYSIFEYSDLSEGFDLNRVYFQYTDNLADDLFLKIRYDIGRSSDYYKGDENFTVDDKFYGYLKNAYIDWKGGSIGKVTIGLLGTNSYNVQENTWGYRFIAKSVPDEWKMTNTADFGIGWDSPFTIYTKDKEHKIALNIQLLNGDGYKAEGNKSASLATYFRFLYGESKLNKNDGYNVGVVITSLDGDDLDNDKNLMGIFGGWSGNNLRFGFEHNSYEYGTTIIVNSFYINYSTADWNIFARHDMKENKDTSNEDLGKSYVGAIWNPTKGLYISPNIVFDDNSENENEVRLTFMFKY